MKQLILFLAALPAFAQYVPTARTYTDKENGLVLQSCLNNSLATNCNGTGQYGIGANIENPNTITQFTQMDASAIKAWHGVGNQWTAGSQHVGSFDLRDELEAYEAAEVAAGRGKLFITSGGNPVYWDNSTFPYGKQPINMCDPRFVRFMANEQIRRRMLSPSNPGAAQSPQYQNGWQSWDEGGYLLYSVFGFPGGTGDGSTWDPPFPQNQAQATACAASFYTQLAAIAPDIQIIVNQGSLAEPNGTVNNNDLALFQQFWGSSQNLHIDREQFITQGTSTTSTQTFYNLIQNQTLWLLPTGKTALWRADVDGTAGQLLTSALAYLLAREGNSYFSEAQNSLMIDPNNATTPWATIFEEMGNPTSAPSFVACSPSCGSDYSNVIITRSYEGGLVYYNNGTTSQTVTLPAGTWYNSASSVVTTLTLPSYTSGVDTQVAQYVTNVNYTGAPIVQQPQISPLGNGTITGPITGVTITDGTSGATICYTTDGTMPTASGGTCTHGTTYSTTLTISTTTTLTAIASHSGDTNSWERATTFTITGTNPTAQFAITTDASTPFFTLTYAAVTLSNPSASSVTVNYTVAGDSNITFSPSSGTAVFAPFQTAVAIPISASLASTVAIDSITATIGTGTGYTVGAQSTYQYTIKRDLKPTVTAQYAEINASSWGQGRSDLPTDNQNAATVLTTGPIPSTPANFRTAYKFSGLSAIPSTATVTKATMIGYIPTSTDTGYTVTGGSCTTGVITLTIGSNAIVVGQPIVVTGITPSGYNTGSAIVTARSGTTVSYAATCPAAYSSGGNVGVFSGLTSVYPLINGFTQSTVDWSNFFVNTSNANWGTTPTDSKPATAGASTGNSAATLQLVQTANHYLVTSDVQNIINSTSPNNGWAMVGPEATPQRATFNWLTSSASNAPPSQPSLLVQFSTPASCTISVTSPSASASITGIAIPFTVAIGNCPSAARVDYLVDAYRTTNTGLNALEAAGTSIVFPYSYIWNSNWYGNGNQHQVTAKAYDALGTLLATSLPVTFTIANTQPVSYVPGCTTSPGIAYTSPWFGQVAVPVTVTGAGSGNQKTFEWFLDGIPQQLESGTAATKSVLIDTTQLQNGSGHVVAGTVIDTDSVHPGGTWYQNGFYQGLLCEFSYQITVSNSVLPSEVVLAAHDIYLTPGSTFSLAPSLINTDGSTASPPTFEYMPMNSISGNAVYTVNSSGLVTASAVTTQSAQSAQVMVMAETLNGGAGCNDLYVDAVANTTVHSTSCHTFLNSEAGHVLKITSAGTGLTPGDYIITIVNPDTTPTGATLDHSPGAVNSSGASFTTGPTTDGWVFVWPTNTMPHIGNDKQVHTTYTPGVSILVHSPFNSGDMPVDQQYRSACNPLIRGFSADMMCTAYNAVEYGLTPNNFEHYTNVTGSGGQASFQTDQTTYRSMINSTLAGYNKYLSFSGDIDFRGTADIYATTTGNGAGSPYSSLSNWTASGLQYAMNDWGTNSALTPLIVSMMDEFNYTSFPLQGPITVGASTTQSPWFTSVTSTGTTCTVNGGPFLNAGSGSVNVLSESYLTISGSVNPFGTPSINGLNYKATFATSSSFSFPCTAAAGTYTSSNDPGLTINPLTTNFSTGGNVTTYDALAKAYVMTHAATTPPLISWPPAAPSNCTQITNVMGPGNGQSLLSTSTISDYSDRYWTHINENYLPTRMQSYSTADSIPFVGFLGNDEGIGYLMRAQYGCMDPGKPLIAIAPGQTNNHGMEGYQVAVTSFVGNTITTATPHGISNIIPGNTRLFLSGTSNAADSAHVYPVTGASCTSGTATLTIGANTLNIGETITIVGTLPNQLFDSYTGHAVTGTTGTTVSYSFTCPGGTYTSGGTVTGADGPGEYYILSAPTPTTLTVARAALTGTGTTPIPCTGSCATGSTGTLTFNPATCTQACTQSLLSMTASGNTVDGIGGQTGFQYTGSPNSNVNKNRGQTFTVSVAGTNATYYNNHTFVYASENLTAATDTNNSPANFLNFYREIPVGSSTGGTATILPDNRFVPGISAWRRFTDNATNGWAFGNVVECAVVRCVGERIYKADASANGANQTPIGSPGSGAFAVKGGYLGFNLINSLWGNFLDNSVNFQMFSNPHFEDGMVVSNFYANEMPMKVHSRWAKYLLTPAVNSPDLGTPFVGSVGARSQMLFGWNKTAGTQTATVNTTPYLQSGQQFVRYIVNWYGRLKMTVLSAGTTSDTITLGPDEAFYYVFPTNFAAEIQQPTVSVRLADITGATSWAVRYGYSLYWLDAPADMVVNCGSAATCTVPVDLGFQAISPIWYRILYLGSAGQVLSEGDVQQF